MAHHKRRRPKNRRAGCLFCKPYKGPHEKRRWGNQRPAWKRALIAAKEQLVEL